VTAVTGIVEPGAGGGGPCVTVDVASEFSESEPLTFVAVTRTRRVLPTSPDCTVYIWSSAVGIPTQLLPPGLHRSHRYVNTIGWSPVHVPGPAVSCWPVTGEVSEIVGLAVFDGLTWAAVGSRVLRMRARRTRFPRSLPRLRAGRNGV
jgi:hypothetical protein